MLEEPEYAFFELRSGGSPSTEEILGSPILFRLWVFRRAHSQGRWTKIATAPVSEALGKVVLRYNQDPIDPRIIRLTEDGIDGPLVTAAECEGYECAAVWDPEEVEDRLADHFAGIPYRGESSLRPVDPA